MAVLLTGGAGYIGSHACVELLEQGYEVVVVDNFMNSSMVALDRVKYLTGKEMTLCYIDLLDEEGLERVFQNHYIEAVIHFAGLKAVGESVAYPLRYYHNNVTGTLTLIRVMDRYDVKTMIFSSSATVYGEPETTPITEDFPLSATNPYGRTKLMIEEILYDLSQSDSSWSITILRYFNPIGAHPSGLIGESPDGVPNNLLPYVTQVAVGRRPAVQVFGNNYNTVDGTGVRDYIHVVDLAIGHIRAVEKANSAPGIRAYNLGTGEGYSVLQVIEAMTETTEIPIPFEIVGPRSGDIAECYANPQRAKEELQWEATRTLYDMCRDAWRWQSENPYGYKVRVYA
ncbi:UDP-glucose 4-epimerase GalE [Pontibacillus salicampi]|uniref:UDP-glucose 4-epimerase n=1 Tax=Pontibacillus salicampi TaxID=1449801 RepID=A0ABV6LQF8_9BACI